ncbi:MAG: proline dehydrogenase family protein [Candidatus Heimdallarchaeum aukensis]|uniref:Proline dehydrogenase family protein n=1 Tax=Candidatus Heimdallarchaeum aukensis TaxID=2876573 RepID=A0A9Y1BI31_9ARCH|nr:MAG: proline dehydrogenase family protein [Candidatus Heimdallarchaeum aukensis]
MSRFKIFIINCLPDFAVYFFAKPYLGGNSLEEGINKAKLLWKKGLSSTIDMLGEDLKSKEEVEHAIGVYLKAIDRVNEEQMQDYASISVKPSSLGYLVSEDYYIKNLEKVVSYASEKGIEITIDMEDHNYTDITLKSYKLLKPKYPLLGTVLQTRLFRTERDIEELGDINARIRLCIGIYREPKEIAYTNKKLMKERLIAFAQELISNNHYVAFATHDEKYIRRMLSIVDEKGLTKDQIEFQMLLGVPRRKIQKEIIERGFVMRLYVPFAEEKKYSIAYLRRRLYENPFMVFSVLKNIFRTIFKFGN